MEDQGGKKTSMLGLRNFMMQENRIEDKGSANIENNEKDFDKLLPFWCWTQSNCCHGGVWDLENLYAV